MLPEAKTSVSSSSSKVDVVVEKYPFLKEKVKLIVSYKNAVKFGVVGRDAAGHFTIKFVSAVKEGIISPIFEKDVPAKAALNDSVEVKVVSGFPTGRYGQRKSERIAAATTKKEAERAVLPAPKPSTEAKVVGRGGKSVSGAVGPARPSRVSAPAPIDSCPLQLPAPASPLVASPPAPVAPAASPAQVEALLNRMDAMSGVPSHLNSQQLFRLGRIRVPDAQHGLTGTYLVEIVKAGPPQGIPASAMEALVKTTRDQHVNNLKTVARSIDPSLPLDCAIVKALEKLAAERAWKKSTLMKTAASVQGALRILPLYFAGAHVVMMRDSPVWKMSMVAFQHWSKQELPNQPKAASWSQVAEVVRSTKCDAQAMAILLGWLTAARLGCIRSLSKEHVVWDTKSTRVTFHLGKGARARGPYTVHAQPIPAEFRKRWKTFFDSRESKMFPRHLTGDSLKVALRAVDKSLEQRSLRRGALQTMASNGVSEETLMRYSGHTQVATLRRYLNWNTINSKVQEEMVQSGKALVARLPKSALSTTQPQSRARAGTISSPAASSTTSRFTRRKSAAQSRTVC